MKMKAKLTKAEYEALDEAKQAFYVADGDNFKLDIDDSEVAAEMRRARDREKTRADEAEAQLTEMQTRIEELEKGVKKTDDIKTIEAGWQKKLDKVKADSDKVVATLKKQLETVMVDAALQSIATDIFTKPSRDVRLLKDRAYVDYDGETPVLRIRDKDGKASALTLDDLKKETVDNPDYKDILIGSKATGSGGTGGKNGGGAPKQPSEMNDSERADLYRRDPVEFRRLFPDPAA